MGTARRQYPDEFKREALELFGKQWPAVEPDCWGAGDFLLSGCGRGATEATGAKRDRRGAPTRRRRSRLLAWIW